MRIVQSPVSRLAARSRGGPVRQRGARRATVNAAESDYLEHLTQHVCTAVAQLAAPVSAEQAKVPCEGTPHERVRKTHTQR
jgi:hypothetical protein